MSAQTHEERLREMSQAAWNGEIFMLVARDCPPLEAGATALAITREIAEMEEKEGWVCGLCGAIIGEQKHSIGCIYLKCVELHARR